MHVTVDDIEVTFSLVVVVTCDAGHVMAAVTEVT